MQYKELSSKIMLNVLHIFIVTHKAYIFICDLKLV